MRKTVHVAVLAVGLPFAGCASVHHDPLSIDPVVQADAPVQIVRIQPSGDNLLAIITVKNMTDRPIEDFDIGWEAFRNKTVNSYACLAKTCLGKSCGLTV